MKVAEEDFLIIKGAEGARCEGYPNFQVKGLLPDRTLASFIIKALTGQFLNFRRSLTEFTKNNIS